VCNRDYIVCVSVVFQQSSTLLQWETPWVDLAATRRKSTLSVLLILWLIIPFKPMPLAGEFTQLTGLFCTPSSVSLAVSCTMVSGTLTLCRWVLYLVPCTAVLVGLWPVSDKVFPLTSVQEQCWMFDLLHEWCNFVKFQLQVFTFYTTWNTHTRNRFTAVWILSGTTQVSWYQKEHSIIQKVQKFPFSLVTCWLFAAVCTVPMFLILLH